MSRLDGKVAIVTGAAGGIGRAMVLELAREGAQVVAADIDREGLAETEELAQGVGTVSSRETDVSEEADVAALVAAAVKRYGRLTTMCNNAAVNLPGDVEHLPTEMLDRTLAVNVRGPFLGCKYAIPELRKAGGGSLINVGSVNSFMAERQLVAYCASKGAILMLSRAIAADYARERIRCNCICPGFVDTPFNVPHFELLGGADKIRATLSEDQPIGRSIEPSEIATAAVFLASDDSQAVTGSAFVVDGGISVSL